MMNCSMDLYTGQKTIMRQFLILKKLGDVPDQVNLEHIKDFLLREAVFGPAPHHVLRRPMLEGIEKKVFIELEKEQRLSKQFERKVTLEGLEMFLCMIRPAAEDEVRKLLLPLFSNLACSAVPDTKGERESFPPAGDAGSPNEQVPSTSTLLQTAEKLVPELVTATLNYLLEDREEQLWGSLFSSEQTGLTSIEGRWAKAAIVDVFRLVEDAVSSVLPPQDVSALASVTLRVVKNMVVAIFQRFEHALTSFQLIGHDSTECDGLAVTRSVISAIVDEMEMGDWEPEDFSNQMCDITTTAGTPEVSMKDLLLKAARALGDKNNISEDLTVEDDLSEAAPKMSAQARGHEAAPKVSSQARGHDAAPKRSAQARGHEAAPKRSAQARGYEAALKRSAQARGHDAAPKRSAQARGYEAALKRSAQARGHDAAPKRSAQARGHEAAPKRSVQARGYEAALKRSAQARGYEAALKMSAQARGPEAAPKRSAQARGPAVAMEDVLQEPVMAHSDKVMKAVITEVTLDQVQPAPRSPNTIAASRFSEETLRNLLEVEAPKVKPELSHEKPNMVIGCVLATTSDLQHPMTFQVLGDVCRDVPEQNRGVSQNLLKKHKKGGIRGFFRRVRKLFSCCGGLPTEED